MKARAAALIWLLGIAIAAVVPASNTDQRSQLGAYLERVGEEGFDGVVLVARGEETLLFEAHGHADKGTRTPNTIDTVFDLGSIAKQFTAAAIVHLQTRGLLSVDDRISRFFPDAPADKADITIHQLLTHTAGLAHDHASSDAEPLGKDEFLARVFEAPLESDSGERYSYSNSGYSVLAAIVEQVSGEPFQTYLQEKLWAPLGLSSMGFFNDPHYERLPVATGYFNGEPTGNPASFAGPYWGVIGNGEILSTVGDLRAWMWSLFDHTLLSPSETDLLFTRHVAEGGSSFYGYGWSLADTQEGPVITHNGGGRGGNSDVAFYPDHELLIIVCSNEITYRDLGGIPYDVSLPATELRRSLAANLTSGDFSALPRKTFSVYRYLAWVAVALAGVGALLLRWRMREQ